MARRTRRRRTSSRRRVRRNPFKKVGGRRRYVSSWPGAVKRRRRAAAKKGWAKRKVRKSRRSSARRTRRSPRRRRTHFRTYRSLSRKYGPRRAAKVWRRRRKYVRSNPFSGFLPSMSSITGAVKDGLGIGAGWVAVNGAMMLLDKAGLGTLKAKQSPTVQTLINFAARLLLTPVVAKYGSKFLGVSAKNLAMGGAFNAVYHGAQDLIAANPTMVPDAAKPLLLGYDGYSDWASYGSFAGVSDYASLPYGGMQGLAAVAPDGGYILA